MHLHRAGALFAAAALLAACTTTTAAAPSPGSTGTPSVTGSPTSTAPLTAGSGATGSTTARSSLAGPRVTGTTLTGTTATGTAATGTTVVGPSTTAITPARPESPVSAGLPGMPPVTDPHNIYAAAATGLVKASTKKYPAYAYVPHNKSGDVWVIDQRTRAVLRKCHVGNEVQHVVPSYKMTELYATDDIGNVIRVIDPLTGRCGRTIPVIDPYNMYFTPDGRYAISVAEALRELVWYDPVTWKVHDITAIPKCDGVDHADFSVDGRTAVFTCEFAGQVAVVDVASHKVLRFVRMPVMNMMMGPQDIKIAPDGSVYYIADSDSNGVWVLNGAATKVLRHIATGRGAHGLYLSRDAKQLYVTNRLDGSISVLDAYTGAIRTKWVIPGGGSPDMGNVSADGKQLWITGRYDNVVYVIDTAGGRLLDKIPVGNGPHGMALMPLPGRYSLGHTGITR